MPKKKSSRKRKVIHQKIEKVRGFSICSKYGTPSDHMRRAGVIETPIRIRVDERGVIGTRAAAEKKMKELEKAIREEYMKPPRNMPKTASLETGLYLKEITFKTSYAHKMF